MSMTDGDTVLQSENLHALVDELQQHVKHSAQQGDPLHDVELTIWKQLLRLGRQALQQFLDLVGSGDQGEAITLPDGQVSQRLDHQHQRRYVSLFGEFRLSRTVYGTREGQKIDFVPLDNRLQLPHSPFSYVLQDWDQAFCVEQAFGPSAQVIQRILGLRQSVDSLERMTQEMAQEVIAFREARPAPSVAEEAEVLVSSADGKGIVMRRTAQDKASGGHRRKGEKASRKRMATVGAVYSVARYRRTPEEIVAALFRDGPPPTDDRPKPQHKHVWAWLPTTLDGETVSGVDLTYSWLQEEVQSRQRTPCQELVHLADGQECLWEARATYLPDNVVDILDLLHVSPRVWQAAHVFHKEGSAEAEHFVRERLLKILQGHSDRVVRDLRAMASKHGLKGSKRKTLQKVCAYLQANRERMHYEDYLAKGYPIASGVIEGACRHLVKDRMERAGMHWTLAGAQAMLDVRSMYLEGAWDAYQTYRIHSETQRLYPFRALVEGSNFQLAA